MRFGDRLVSKLEPTLEPERFVRRIEVINGTGRRREWSAEDKARIVEETLAPDAVVSVIARRHGLSPQQLFTWRRAMRRPTVETASPERLFVPAVLEAPTPEPSAERPPPRRRREITREAGAIELTIDGVVMRVTRGADARTVAAVIRALKASA